MNYREISTLIQEIIKLGIKYVNNLRGETIRIFSKIGFYKLNKQKNYIVFRSCKILL